MGAKAITVTLAEMSSHAERHLASGRYASMSEGMRGGLRDRALIGWMVYSLARMGAALPMHVEDVSMQS